jgi:hypothetical protein
MAQVADATIELPLEPFPGGQARSTKILPRLSSARHI